MNTEIWAIGLTGAAVGGALGWPLIRRPAEPLGFNARLLGVILLLGAIATALIGADHGNLLPPLTDRMAAHIVSAGDLLLWSLLVIWIRGATGRPLHPPARAALIAVPMIGYLLLASGHGFRPPRFIWLLPVGVAAAAYVTALWRHAPALSIVQRGLVTRVVALGWALNGAQALRTFWPDVEWLREIVPIAATAGFLSIGALAMRTLVGGRRPDPPATMSPRYERSALDASAAAALVAALDRGMRDGRWYRDPALTLSALAARAGARPHAVSQALNQHAGRTFNEYVTAWRLADARARLEDPDNDRFTVDALAEGAGFKSRAAFYRAFKAAEGLTPTEFRARARG